MKTIYKTFLALGIVTITSTSCQKNFDKLTTNNNVPTDVPASLLLQGVVNSLPDGPDGQYEIWSQYHLYNYDYYGNNRYDFGAGTFNYTTLKNVILMEQAAAKANIPSTKPYSALGKFFRAYFFSKMTLQMGDIPMTQALQGLDNLTPAYDTQKAVFIQIFKWLEDANTDLTTLINSGITTVDGDIFFTSGDLTQWRKVVNAFRLRMLLELSKKTSDTDLNVAAQFASIVNNPAKYPLMTSLSDNLQYVFLNPTNYYPETPSNFGQNAGRKNMSSTYVSLLTASKDPRVFITADPARYLVDNQGQSATDFASFVGADPGLDLGIMYNNAIQGQYSFIGRKRYYSTFTGEPSIQVGYMEQMLNIAEGINRGWVTGNAEDYYIKGIQASFQWYNIPVTGTFTASFYRPGSTNPALASNYDNYTITTNWDTFYNQPAVKYAGGTTGLTQILQQKYLAGFRHNGLESYYTYRRTAVPNFTTGTGTGNSGHIALRFQYPSSERTANTANYNAAVSSQYGTTDDINGTMWILK
ncbi:SusD-like starch-binding protein associating with outer membrane [Mucilaginibacter gracilis]|uniref:SusD-like starch-binding protein associating with outer membrane n=1 Tax=Mucilaginibacter gracilis TaxID=423350 RepID=A0A495J774_9SPHI|nr:SusD/RagB family nutrient-binding outer membrane lipoprotein [Mucilaginibacter gracilis]RKR84258.1 SusD-like starch-binding protein associating with outer membrane [Mucilaginibacter gracilis]